jgi:hypothetical protein
MKRGRGRRERGKEKKEERKRRREERKEENFISCGKIVETVLESSAY